MTELNQFEVKVIDLLERISLDLKKNWDDHSRFKLNDEASGGESKTFIEYDNWESNNYLKSSMLANVPRMYDLLKSISTYTSESNVIACDFGQYLDPSVHNSDSPALFAIKKGKEEPVTVNFIRNGNILNTITIPSSDEYVYPLWEITTDTDVDPDAGWIQSPQSISTGYFTYYRLRLLNEDEIWQYHTRQLPDVISDNSYLTLYEGDSIYGGPAAQPVNLVGLRSHPDYYDAGINNNLDYSRYIDWTKVTKI